jgi:IS4 transposase
MDATIIELCATMFDWAKFRQAKGALKVHLLLDHDGYLPVFAHITEGREHELLTLRKLHFGRGTIVVFDRAYNDYRLFERWCSSGVFFVTRMKKNAYWTRFKKQVVPQGSNVLRDEVGEFQFLHAGRKVVHEYRKVTVWVEEKKEELVLLTNNFRLSARTIAAIYKERWQIELFFKALKQNLRVKTFVGTSANAVHIQIWTALIAVLLLKHLQFRATLSWALSTLVALLRWNLFTYRDLWAWINKPTDTPPESARSEQLSLVLDSI